VQPSSLRGLAAVGALGTGQAYAEQSESDQEHEEARPADSMVARGNPTNAIAHLIEVLGFSGSASVPVSRTHTSGSRNGFVSAAGAG